MSELAEKIKTDALLLSPEERAALASFLLQSLDDSTDQAHIEGAWKKELERRWAEIEGGQGQGIPALDLIAKLRAKYS